MKKLGIKIVGVIGLFFSMMGFSFAALPQGATDAFTTLSTDALALVDLAWTVAVPITVAFIVLGLFKRAASSGV